MSHRPRLARRTHILYIPLSPGSELFAHVGSFFPHFSCPFSRARVRVMPLAAAREDARAGHATRASPKSPHPSSEAPFCSLPPSPLHHQPLSETLLPPAGARLSLFLSSIRHGSLHKSFQLLCQQAVTSHRPSFSPPARRLKIDSSGAQGAAGMEKGRGCVARTPLHHVDGRRHHLRRNLLPPRRRWIMARKCESFPPNRWTRKGCCWFACFLLAPSAAGDVVVPRYRVPRSRALPLILPARLRDGRPPTSASRQHPWAREHRANYARLVPCRH